MYKKNSMIGQEIEQEVKEVEKEIGQEVGKEIEVEDIGVVARANRPSTKRQREQIDYLGERAWMGYNVMLLLCGEVVGRRVKDLGELTAVEAGMVLDVLRERNRGNHGTNEKCKVLV